MRTPPSKKILAIALASCLLSACQSIPHTTAGNQSLAPKSHLGDVLRHQLRSNFSYESTLHISNQARLARLQSPSDDGLSATLDNAVLYCGALHDTAYKDLLIRADNAGLDISADYYLTDKATIRQDYEACLSKQEPAHLMGVGRIEQLQPAHEFFAADDVQAHIKALQANSDNLLDEAYRYYIQKGVNDDGRTPTKDDYVLDGYEFNQKNPYIAKDLHKAELLKAYLLDPVKASVVGSYRPVQGVITAVPTLRYDQKNLSMMVNQPVYLDIKAGVLYLWADNLAFAQSSLLDKELGTAWQNKWLALPMNDGSLPADFYQDFVQGFLTAQKTVFDDKQSDDFVYINADEFYQITKDVLPAGSIDMTTQIIKYEQNSTKAKSARHDMLSLWYTAMTDKYPELLPNPPPELFSRAELSRAEKSDTPADIAERISSKVIMQRLFTAINQRLLAYDYYTTGVSDDVIDENELVNEPIDEQNNPSADEQDRADEMAVWLDDGTDVAEIDGIGDTAKAVEQDISQFYGVQGNRLLWVYQPVQGLDKYNMPSKYGHVSAPIPRVRNSQLSVQAGVFTRFDDKPLTVNFPRLPKNAQTPNASNSIDVLAYGRDLVERLKDDEASMAQLMLRVLVGAESERDGYLYDDYSYDEYDTDTDINCMNNKAAFAKELLNKSDCTPSASKVKEAGVGAAYD
ncbi:MAG: hypothetical protein Q4G13_02410 [Moraxella sp.]|nr:hypothetical protein [Moraxella sp.]